MPDVGEILTHPIDAGTAALQAPSQVTAMVCVPPAAATGIA